MPYKFTHIPGLALLDREGTVNNQSNEDYGIETYTLNIDMVQPAANTDIPLNLELPAGGVLLNIVMLTNTIPQKTGPGNALSLRYIEEGETVGNTMANVLFPDQDDTNEFTIGTLVLTTDPIPPLSSLSFTVSNDVTANVDVFFQILTTEPVVSFIEG
jgi:hypothetical protein